MRKSAIIALILLAVILIGGYVFTFGISGNVSNLGSENDSKITGGTTEDISASEKIIIYTDSGYSPKEMTVSLGETVTWTNKASRDMWPASAMHPTHTVYPNSSIEKCGTSEEQNIFDACRGISPEESYTFIFSEAGTWFYHDHLNPKSTGKITVN